MYELDRKQRLELERIKEAISQREPELAAAVSDYNATVKAAFEKLGERIGDYTRARDEFDRFQADLVEAMTEFAGASPAEWRDSEEGQEYFEWINAWLEVAVFPLPFRPPPELTTPELGLSAIIAGLPREPGDFVEASVVQSAFPDAPMELALEERGAGTVGKRYFEFTGGTSNKFWEVSQEDSAMTTRYGKIGTGGQSNTKSFDSPAKAALEMAKIIAKKVKEGYVEKKSSQPAASSADPETMLGTVLPSASDRKRRLFAVACCRRLEQWLIGTYALDYRDDDYRRAVETTERFADGKATSRELYEAFWGADDSAFCNYPYRDELWTTLELRKATFGDDAGWPARLLRRIPDEDRQDLQTDPAALDEWLEAGEDASDYLNTCPDPFRDVAAEDPVLIGETIGRKLLLIVRDLGGRPREAQERTAQAALVGDIFGDPFPPPAFDPTWRTPDVTSLAENIYEERAFDRMPILADALEEAGCTNPVIVGHCRGPGPHVRGCWVLDLVLEKK